MVPSLHFRRVYRGRVERRAGRGGEMRIALKKHKSGSTCEEIVRWYQCGSGVGLPIRPMILQLSKLCSGESPILLPRTLQTLPANKGCAMLCDSLAASKGSSSSAKADSTSATEPKPESFQRADEKEFGLQDVTGSLGAKSVKRAIVSCSGGVFRDVGWLRVERLGSAGNGRNLWD